MTRAFIGSLIFTVIAPGAVAGYIPYLIATQHSGSLRVELGVAHYFGGLMLALGAAIYVWCVAGFVRAQGTPAPVAPTRELVAGGLYRYVRNPMYVGVLTAISGWAVWFGSGAVAIYGAGIFVLVHLFVIGYEEPTLRRTFGESYERYCRDVPRWIPRLKGR